MKRYRTAHPGVPVLYVDAGRAFPLKTQETDVVVPAMVESFQELGLDALNVADEDLDSGLGFYNALVTGAKIPAVSANLWNIDTGQPPLPPYLVTTPRLAGGRAPGPRVAVVGFNDPIRYRVIGGRGGQKYHFVDIMKAAADVIPKARAESDFLLVTGSMGVGPSRMLIDKYPDIDLIVITDERLPEVSEVDYNGVPIVATGVQGKRDVHFECLRSGGPRRWKIVTSVTALSDTVRVDPDATRLVDRFQSDLTARAQQKAAAARPDPHFPAYVGAAACQSCHAAEYTVWSGTRHYHAWDALGDGRSTRNPLCLECHTVAYLRPNGFADEGTSRPLKSVGCESCHGPGGRHVANPTAEKMWKVSEETCRGCHTSGQSPDFDFARYWARIKH